MKEVFKWHLHSIVFVFFISAVTVLGLITTIPKDAKAIGDSVVVDSLSVSHNNTSDRDTISSSISYTIITNNSYGYWNIEEDKSGNPVAEATNIASGITNAFATYDHSCGGTRQYTLYASIKYPVNTILPLIYKIVTSDPHFKL